MLWIEHTLKRKDKGADVVRLDPPLHGANVNDAPLCEHGQHMASIKRDPDSPSGLVLRYWRCHCVVPLVGAEYFRYLRQMRQAMARKREPQKPTLPFGRAL
jgi:hypothetical protein